MDYYTKTDVVTAALRELIITGGLAPGTELRQRDLATRFDVSPTPVREALKRLEIEGLVTADAHRGARVIDTAFPADEENFLVRAVLERLAVGLAVDRVTDRDLEDMLDLNAQLADLPDGDPRASEINRQLHFRVYEAARSPMLLALLRLLWRSFPGSIRVRRPIADSVRQHAEIIEALQRHDRRAAEDAITHHILEYTEVELDEESGS